MEKFNEIDLTADRREMGMGRAIVLLIASLLLWCGSMLLFLDHANVSDNQWQVALIGSLMAAIGGSWLWADFFGVTAWWARERWVTGYIAQEIPPAFMPKVLHKRTGLLSRLIYFAINSCIASMAASCGVRSLGEDGAGQRLL